MNAQKTQLQSRTRKHGANNVNRWKGAALADRALHIQPMPLTVTLFILLFATANATWYNSSWLYRKAITLESDLVPSDQTNFPVLVNLPADSDLASKALSDGNDILFTSSNGTTKLSHEIEDFNSSTGELVAHVKIPTLSSSTDTTIYLYYGNSSVTSQQDTNNVWDSNYVLVQHLNEKTMNPRNDSTANDNDGTPNGLGTGSSLDFNGSTDYVNVNDSTSLDLTTAYTLEAWVKRIEDNNDLKMIVSKTQSATTRSYALYVWNKKICGYVSKNGSSTNRAYGCSVNTFSANEWTHFVAVYDGSGPSLKLYMDGVEDTGIITTDGSWDSLYNSPDPVRIGHGNWGVDYYFDGNIDEVRIYSRALSANEIQEHYEGTFSDESNLVGLWHFDEGTGSTAADSSGQGNNGTITGATWSTASPLNDATGKINGADEFNGSDDYVRIPISSSLQTTQNAITLSAWVYHKDTSSGMIVNNHIQNYGSPTSGAIFSISNGNYPSFQLRLNNTCCQTLSSTNSIDTNQWYHLVATWDGSTMKIYRGGILDTSASASGTNNMNRDIFIGINADDFFDTPSQYNNVFNGSLDSVRISNSARDENWISTSYNNQSDPEAFYSLGTEEVESGTALSSWLYRKKITIDHSQVSVDLNDFPVLVNLPADSDLAARARSDGNDIIFVPSATTWSSGTSNDRYCFEIEKFTSSTGELVAWVKIPSLSSSADTNVYLYYGNASQTSSLENKCTWDSHHKMVQHLSESPANDVAGHYDSTSHANDGTPKNFDSNADSTTDTTGKTNGADLFDGTNDYVDCGSDESLDFGIGSFTAEAWIKTSTNDGGIFGKYNVTGGENGWSLELEPSKLRLYFYDGDTSEDETGSTDVNDNAWHHVALIRDSTNSKVYLYIDSVKDIDAVDATAGNSLDSTTALKIGDKVETTYNEFFNGTLDSVRISNTARSADWISTSYNNQSDPEQFYSLGTEQHYSSTALSNWSYRKKITIDSDQVSADLADFPVLINLPADSDLASDARSDGNDIIFVPSSVSWSSGTSNDRYCYEIEKFTSSTGELVAWVKIPSLSSSADTNIYLYYGNASQSTGLENKCTWDSHYKMVQHLDESPANSVAGHIDSTPHGNTGTPYNFDSNSESTTDATGKINGANLFDGTADNVSVANNNGLEPESAITLEAWIKRQTAGSQNKRTVIGKYSGSIGYGIEYWGSQSQLYFILFTSDGGKTIGGARYLAIENEWHHVIATYDGSAMKLYLDGDLKTEESHTGSIVNYGGTLAIGTSRHNSSWKWSGYIDSVRVSDTNRSSSWISTSYNNQSDPEAFYSLGAEQNYSSTALSNWSYRKKITIDHTQVSADLTDFPVLINFSSDSDLAGNARSDGNDIIFVPSSITWSAGTTWDRYCHEIEDFNSSTGELVAWVKIPSLSSTTDTEIYLYYGNASQSTGLENRCTWDSHYKMVQHLNEAPANSVAGHIDSTSHGNTGTPYNFDNNADSNTSAPGKINGADKFDRTNDYVSVAYDSSLEPESAITLEAWIKRETDGLSGNKRGIIGKYNTDKAYEIQYVASQSKLAFVLFTSDGGVEAYSSMSLIGENEWQHVVGTYDGSAMKFYIDGAFDTETSHSGTIVYKGTSVKIGGSQHNSSWLWDGLIDSVRISDTNRSSDWISTSYNNQNSPSTFLSLGGESGLSSVELAGWFYRKKITIDHSQVEADLENFPVLVHLSSDSDLASRARSDGNDIIFAPDTASWSTGTTDDMYCFEMEKYTSSTGELVAWVKIPSLSSSTDTNFYLYYGNASQSTSLENSCTWDDNYVMVQHLEESPANDTNGHLDSTSNSNDGTPKNFDGISTSTTDGTGKIDGADVFDGANDYVTNTAVPGCNLQTFTTSVWVKSNQANLKTIIRVDDRKSWDGWHVSGDFSNGEIGFTGDNGITINTNGSGLQANTWYFMTAVYNSGTVTLYLDGINLGSGSVSISYTTTDPLIIFGSDYDSGYSPPTHSSSINGTIDSVRISNMARDGNWILTSYNNQSSPATFCLLESEEELGWVHVVLTYSTANGLKLYVNGELEDSNVANGSIATNDENVVIGQGYDGRIEELKVYADELSAGEIESDYNSWMSGSFTSAVYDASLVSTWTALGWSESTESRFSRVRLRVRACSEEDCSGTSFSGSSGVGSFFNDYSGNDLNALRGQYFQFKAFLDSNSVDWLPVLQDLSVDYNQYHSVGYFISENFVVANKSAWTGVVLTGSTPDGTGTYFQTSTDDGVTWRYWNGSDWVVAGEEFNELSVLNANIGGLTGNSLKFKVKLTSDGSYTPVLESITIQYEAVEE